MNAKTDDLITRFLLGELSEQERAQVEAQFLADNEFFEEILSAEDALLEQYLQGQLSGERLERAKTLFHSSPRQKREVEFTQGLIASLRAATPENKQAILDATQAVAAETTEQTLSRAEIAPADTEPESSARTFTLIPPGFFKHLAARPTTIGWVLISLICFSLLSWIVYLYSQKKFWEIQLAAVERSNQEAREKLLEATQDQAELSKQLEDERERRARAEELIAQLQIRKPNSSSTKLDRIITLILAPATLERGSNPKTIKLKAETNRIHLQLEVPADRSYSRYSVLLTTFDGRSVWNNDAIDASQIKQGRLSLFLPPSLLEYEDYRIELKGLLDSGDFVHVADYIFKVRQ